MGLPGVHGQHLKSTGVWAGSHISEGRSSLWGVLHRQGGWSTGDKQDWVVQGQVRIEQKSHLNPEEKVSLWFYLLDQ